MANIKALIDNALQHEGKYQAWTQDRGNYLNGRLIGTNFGITAYDLAEYRGDQSITAQDMRDMKVEEAREIYEKKYYIKPKIDQLPDELESVVFDMVLNSGTAGISVLQRTLNAFDLPCDVDGKIGPQVVRLSNQLVDTVPFEVIMAALVEERKTFYENLMARRPDQERFRGGWMRRAESFRVDGV